MCRSVTKQNKNGKSCRRIYDDHASKRFDRSRIEKELFNFFDDKSLYETPDDVAVDHEDLSSPKKDCSDTSQTNLSTGFNQNCCDVEDTKMNMVKGQKQNHTHKHAKLDEVDTLTTSHDSIFSFFNDLDLLDDNNSLDPLLISFDLEEVDFEKSFKSHSSQISYDDSTIGSSVDEGLSIATESQYQYEYSPPNSPRSTRGIFMLSDEARERSSIAKKYSYIKEDERPISRSSDRSLLLFNSPCKSTHSTLMLNEETENESQTAIGYSKGSSRFTTDSPKILDLREKKRLMERSYEKKYSKFPTLIELDVRTSAVY